MATYADLTVDAEDILGIDFDPSRCSGWIEAGGDDGVLEAVVVDATKFRIGGRREKPVNGVITFNDLVTTNSASNPTSFFYRVRLIYVPKGSRSQGQDEWVSGWFPLTADRNLAAIPEAWDPVAAPVSWRSEFMDQAQALLDAQMAIAGPVDSTVEALVKNTGGVGPLTSAALLATIAAVTRPPNAVNPLTGMVHADQFGANGQGGDQITALAAAMAYSAANPIGYLPDVLNGANLFPVCRTVYVKPGEYGISDSMVKPNGVSLDLSTALFVPIGAGMATKPMLTSPIGSVPDQHTFVRGGIFNCKDMARDGIDFKWFAHMKFENIQVLEPLRHFGIMGDPAAPSTSYEAHIVGFDTRRRRGSNPPSGAIGLWLRNASDCETDRVTINGVDIGIRTDLGGTTHNQAHVWNFGGSTPPSISFLDNTTFYTTTYLDCKADSPTVYGFHLAGGWGKVIGGTVYANTNVPDNVLTAVQIGGTQGHVDVDQLAIIGADTSHRIAVDVAGNTLYANISVRNTNVVTENIGTTTRMRRLRLSAPTGGAELTVAKQSGNTSAFAQYLDSSSNTKHRVSLPGEALATGLAEAIKSVTSTYAVTTADSTILASGTFTVTLPNPANVDLGRIYRIKNTGAGTITVATAAGTIDAGTSLAGAGSRGWYQATATGWVQIG